MEIKHIIIIPMVCFQTKGVRHKMKSKCSLAMNETLNFSLAFLFFFIPFPYSVCVCVFACTIHVLLTDLKTLRANNNTKGFPISNNPFMEKPEQELDCHWEKDSARQRGTAWAYIENEYKTLIWSTKMYFSLSLSLHPSIHSLFVFQTWNFDIKCFAWISIIYSNEVNARDAIEFVELKMKICIVIE